MISPRLSSSKANEALMMESALEAAPPESYHDEDEDEELPRSASSEDQSQRTDTGTAFTGDAQGTAVDGAKELRETIIKKEERAVKRSRILVGTAIALCAVAITVAVYLIAKNSDQHSFELEYEGIIKDIRTLVVWEVRYNFALMEQLSASISIAAGYLNSTFPFHTEPKYEITGGFVDGMGGIMSAAFAPFVTEEQREDWGVYSRQHQGWIEESAYLKAVHPVHRDALHGTIQDHEHDRRRRLSEEEEETKPTISRTIYRWENGQKVPEIHQPGQTYAPLWQVSPADYGAVNMNLLSDPRISSLYRSMLLANKGVLSSNFEVQELFDFLFDPVEKIFKKDPHGFILQPVYDAIIEPTNQTIVGLLLAITPFGNLLDRLVPEGKDGIIGVIKDDCGNVMTFSLSSSKAKFLGYEDLHEPEFNGYERVERNIEMYEERIEGVCTHDLYLYPSSTFRDSYTTSKPALFTTLVAIAFLVVIGLFVLYDWTITRRQNKTIHTALKTQAIVTSLFPEEVGKQMINEAQQQDTQRNNNGNAPKDAFRNQNFVGPAPAESNGSGYSNQAALAQLYPEATVMFADLVGFTAWSSMRDPPQVFRLLETLYSSFDEIANRRRVFKVETIGDCYVAVCGLPQQRKNHHIVMARFANDCLHAIGPLLSKLEMELGPDTGELGMRVGLNSGPVTAGVLRADRARFQLFGDTVNVAARMESTGSKNRIHISKDTAELLTAGGRGHWVKPRKEAVHAKGKGQLETFWLEVKNDTTFSSFSGGESTSTGVSDEQHQQQVRMVEEMAAKAKNDENQSKATDESQNKKTVVGPKTQRLVDWNSDILLRLLRQIVAHRQAEGAIADAGDFMKEAEDNLQKPGELVFDELADIISLPKYDSKACKRAQDAERIQIDPVVVDQLKDYVRNIASMYRDNHFHCFEHCSHVTMSVNKLLNRIIAPIHDVADSSRRLHDNTYGITSDPLTQFAVVLSALIHDVDHYGVPNAQLVKEGASIAATYKEKSVAEQNSVDLAWRLLMQDSYKDLRNVIYCNKAELRRFRQIVVVTVMATDIADAELKEKRNARWNKAFSDSSSNASLSTEDDSANNEDEQTSQNRKATIVIEHIIQASDVAHTMQHWHIYRKWNERLFMEMHDAYKRGRTTTDPATFWYKGELGFFDFYIIPLAKKLKECGVFGVSSDEYLNYAIKNRQEWESKGMQAVETYVSKVAAQGTE